MCSATNKVQVCDFVKLILWSAPQHLVEAVSEVEYRSTIAVVAPIFWSDDEFGLDVLANVFKAEFGFNLVNDSVSVCVLFFFPVDVFVNVRYWDEGIDGRTPFRGQAGGGTT